MPIYICLLLSKMEAEVIFDNVTENVMFLIHTNEHLGLE